MDLSGISLTHIMLMISGWFKTLERNSLAGRFIAGAAKACWTKQHSGTQHAPGVADTTSHFIWGWDEISWLSLQPEVNRNNWLKYAYYWLRQTDPNGHLEMPGCRMITCQNESQVATVQIPKARPVLSAIHRKTRLKPFGRINSIFD